MEGGMDPIFIGIKMGRSAVKKIIKKANRMVYLQAGMKMDRRGARLTTWMATRFLGSTGTVRATL